MDFRKIIAFGKSSYVVSLPKDWLQTHKLKRGDVVFLEQDSDSLVITPKEKEEKKEEKKITISVDGKDISRIKREISSAFLNYTDSIIIEGKELHKNAKEITHFIHNLIALEIIEQSSERIVARDFLKVGDISIKSYMRKMDIIIRSMISDLKDISFKNYEEIVDRQEGERRIYLLILKIFKAVCSDMTLMKRIDLKPEEFLSYYRYNFSMQRIGSCIKTIARNMVKLPEQSRKRASLVLEELEKNFISLMKNIYNNDVEKAYAFSEVRDKAVEKLNSVLKPDNKQMFIINERLVWIYFEMHEMNHRIYS